ncbi:hypothetical protein PR202_ga06245 [Eleusine coracana subsp. coracana]|uniref:Reverse transcriptase domain-containing protein n=1 Tax=Eleusine coracana subsp. coracana TaxID=191504 RepID=A0AAV5BXY9_ELECO|nr:hypothetical protein PR202_ga06245 [Eleusine coracana subsp. coracana]
MSWGGASWDQGPGRTLLLPSPRTGPDPARPALPHIIKPYRSDVLQALIKADGTIRHPLAEDQSCPVLQYADDTLILFPTDIEQLPLGAINKYDGQRRAFLWSGEDTVSGAQCLVAWDAVTRPLEHGGLGVRGIAVQNNCMLLKLIHRMFTATDSSWARWVRSRADLSNLTGDMEGTHWAGLRQLLPIYQSITSVKLGNRKSTSFWDDWWLDTGRLSDTFPALASHSLTPSASVHHVLSGELRQHFVPRLSRMAAEKMDEL